MYVAGDWTTKSNPEDFQKCHRINHSCSGGIYSVCKRDEHLLMSVTIVDRLCFKN